MEGGCALAITAHQHSQYNHDNQETKQIPDQSVLIAFSTLYVIMGYVSREAHFNNSQINLGNLFAGNTQQ